MARKIIHVDMDAFYASVEQRDDPGLRGRPVLVGSTPGERGVVAAASYEARRYGVHSAMPTARALELCPHAVLKRTRMGYYRQISAEIRAILRSYTPLVEPVSLDEAYLDVTGAERRHGPSERIGWEIKRRIREEIRLTCSVGVAPNKVLAKLASDLKKPDGFLVIRPDEVEAFLEDLPVARLPGVGRATEAQLRAREVATVGELRRVPLKELLDAFGRWGARLFKLARGEDPRPVTSESETKSISRETTFRRDLHDRRALLGVLGELAEEVAGELRKEGLRARTVRLKVRFSDFDTITRSLTLKDPTDAPGVLRVAAQLLLQHRVGPKREVRLLGVGVSKLEAARTKQLPLFEEPELESEDLARVLKELGDRLAGEPVRSGDLR